MILSPSEAHEAPVVLKGDQSRSGAGEGRIENVGIDPVKECREVLDGVVQDGCHDPANGRAQRPVSFDSIMRQYFCCSD